MLPLESDLVKELSDAGIAYDGHSFFTTFTNLANDELTQAFAEVICRASSRRDWIEKGFPKFLETQVWKRIRYLALAKYGNKCQCCGANPSTGAVLHVDHIKPRSKHPKLALSLDNLQVLCADCNVGKSNIDETDWRNGSTA